FPQQRRQRAAQHLAHSVGDSLLVAGLAVLEFAKPLHQIEELAVDLNWINCRPAMEPLAPTGGIGGPPLPKSDCFLNHGAISVGASVVTQVTTYLFPSRTTRSFYSPSALITSRTILIHSARGSAIRARR